MNLLTGSKRHAIELVPGIVLPGLASLIGLVLVGRLGNATLLGTTSLAWVTANLGSAVMAQGPAQAAMRAMSTVGADPGAYRHDLLRRARIVVPATLVPAVGLTVLRPTLGAPLVFGVLWMTSQSFVLFEVEVLKAQGRFGTSSVLASLRAIVGWTASILAVMASPTIGAVVLPQIAVNVIAAGLVGRFQFARASPDEHLGATALTRTVTWLTVASYAMAYADRYVISILLGPVAVGIYTVGYQLGEGALEVASAPLSSALTPRILREWGESPGGASVARRTRLRGSAAMAATSAAALPVFWLAHRLGMLRLVSPDDRVFPVACIVAVGVGANGIGRLAYAELLAQGRAARALRAVAVAGVTSAIAIPTLTAWRGIVGAAVATLIGYVVLGGVLAFEAQRNGRSMETP